MSHILFVYGTLRSQDQSATHLIPGEMFDLGWFPGVNLLPPDEGKFFHAERVTVSDERLKEIDVYEGYDPSDPDDSLYLRVPYLDGWIYTYNSPLDGKPVVTGGDWIEYERGKKFGFTPGHNIIDDFDEGIQGLIETYSSEEERAY